MSDIEKQKRLKKGQWRPKGRETLRRPIKIYFEKYSELTVDELKAKGPETQRLFRAIRADGDEHLIAGQAPKEYQELVSAYAAAFTAPSGIRKRIFRPRRFGPELLQWLLETYPDGMPFAEEARNGDPEERQFYNDLKYARLLRYFKKVEPLGGRDPVELYYELCKSEGIIITRGQLKHRAMAEKGGNAVYKALERMRDPENPSRSLLEKHVPRTTDKLSAEAKRRFNFGE